MHLQAVRLVLVLILTVSVTTGTENTFDSRLSIGNALDTSNTTTRFAFSASKSEHLYTLPVPIAVYDHTIKEIRIYSNGFIGLGNHRSDLSPHYPSQTVFSKHRLGSKDGDFIGVFTTVNECSPDGKVIIREVDMTKVEPHTCAWRHISRISSNIDISTAESTKPFVAEYVLAITWLNMGCENRQKNSFTLVFLKMESRTYALFQYENIHWTADNSSSSLPPEAGIFIQGVDTPQLPRSNMHADPFLWNEESNIAVPGEWLFPLQEASLDIDVARQSEIRTTTERFLQASAAFCQNFRQQFSTILSEITHETGHAPTEVMPSLPTKSTITQTKAAVDPWSGEQTSAAIFERCHGSLCKGSIAECFKLDGQNCCVCPTAKYYGGGSEGCWSIERPRRIYLDGNLRLNFNRPGHEADSLSVFLDTEVRQSKSILSQSGVRNVPKDFSTIHIITPVFNFLNSFLALPSQSCQTQYPKDSRIFNIFSITAGFSTPFNFSASLHITGHGRLAVKGIISMQSSDEETYRGSLNIDVFPEGEFIPLSSRLFDANGMLQADEKSNRIIEYEKTATGRVEFVPQVYNLMTSTGQTVNVELRGSGTASVTGGACLLAGDSLMISRKKIYVEMGDRGYCSEDCRSDNGCLIYCVDMPALFSRKPGPCDCTACEGENEVCREVGETYSCECKLGFKKSPDGVCRTEAVTDSCRQLRCGQNARCLDGDCRCEPGYSGDPYRHCVRVDPCYNIQCGYNAQCLEGICQCDNGHEGDPNYECRPLVPENRCANVRCGYNAECVDGVCHCYDGYEGDPNQECHRTSLEYDCSGIRCGDNAKCINGQCKCEEGFYGDPNQSCQFIGGDRPSVNPKCRVPIQTGQCFAHLQRYGYNSRSGRCESFIYSGCMGNENQFESYEECERTCVSVPNKDPCKNVRCGRNARCLLGQCVCDPDFQGDPNYECQSVTTNRCRDVLCGRNAQCIDGHCECLPGYEGDPERECRTGDTCRGQRCGQNAYCRDEACHCETSYQGDPYTGCVRIADRCDGVRCSTNAFCENGHCKCNSGYSGDGFISCVYRGSCANVRCGINARCVEGRCECWPGYSGNPDSLCDLTSDQSYCGGRRCGSNALCIHDRCVCNQGFRGDPYYGCEISSPQPEPCGSNYCHEKARCDNGVCFCEYGYVGNGVTICQRVEEDLCKRVQCADNAECEAGLCQCKPGFNGDGFSECTPVVVDPHSCNSRYCGANSECRNNECVCQPGYIGDPYDICTRDRPLPDACYGVECGSNAYCHNGHCICYEGFEGDASLACRPVHDSSCVGIRCGVNTYCAGGKCICRHGYGGDPNQICYPELGPPTIDFCQGLSCHANATCTHGECRCNYGFEGDGFIDCWSRDPANFCDCGGLPPTVAAGCSSGRCRCKPGFRLGGEDQCEECRGHGECASNAQCSYDEHVQLYRCKCNPGFLGDGAIACIAGAVANRTQSAQCRVPCHKFATCDEYNGRCQCRAGFLGNGYTYCDFDCGQCLPEAHCLPESSQCVCPPEFTGDGVRICRPVTSQGFFELRIEKESGTIRLREGSRPLTLRCILTGDIRNVQARWLTPDDVGRTEEHQIPGGLELELTIREPTVNNSGRYVCQGSRITDSVDVIIEPKQTSRSGQLFLTSDNGILTVQTLGETMKVAEIWHIAENNNHMPVALALDCNADRLIYTSDMGRALRFGNSSSTRLNQLPQVIVQDVTSKFTWISVDPTCGNVFAIDDEQNRIVVVNPGRPNHIHTFKKLSEHGTAGTLVAGGIVVHPGLSLVYWAETNLSESESPTSVIKVASMANPEHVSVITSVSGAPISMSLAITNDVIGIENTAGRLCWLERHQGEVYPRSEIHCAHLEASGRGIHSKRLLKRFDSSEEPSNGLIQDDHTILWTDLYRKTYQSLNPSSLVHVKGVCCSNGFQSIAMHSDCKRSLINTCSYDNGRCRFFCLPGGVEMPRVCRCPDDQPFCAADLA